MSVSFENYLVVGISSRALFNLEKENEVFEKEGLDAYRDYQIVHENDVLSPGSGFVLVKNLLNINKLANRKLVEVIVMSRNSADTSLRIIHSLEYYDMDIGRMVLSGGEDISRYLSAFGVDLFLSCNENDVSNAIHAGFAAGMIYARDTKYSFPDNQIRIAFDADAVLFSAESEKIYQEHGLEAFNENEILNQDVALQKGPMASLLKSLSWLQNETKDLNVLRTAIVTARNKDTGVRVIKTLRAWNIVVDEVFFMQGAKKADVLACFGANIFFDDQDVHAGPASDVVPSARVPYKEGEMYMNRHEQRLVAMQSVYQHLLLGKDIRKCVFDVMKGSNDIDGYLYSLTIGTVENKEAFEQKINELLRDDWDFDRLSMLEQAILLISFQEILANDTPKAVVINEAITLAKKYCDDNSYKLLNGVLDQL